ncbi:MAG: DUF434 domain-containing protein [Myxococcales bacterium]
MPDRRQHRGAHPDDARDFASEHHASLRDATEELSWLLGRAYSERAALKLVGDKHQLTTRQREAVLRAACSEGAVRARRDRQVDAVSLRGAQLGIDGFNCSITLEVILSGGPTFVGRDGARRDLASVHGTYRRVSETEPALALLVDALLGWGVGNVLVLFDKPVANSGRLRGLCEASAAQAGLELTCELSERVDQELVQRAEVVASSDAWVLEHARAWADLPSLIVERSKLPVWSVYLE